MCYTINNLRRTNRYYNYDLSVNGKRETHGEVYEDDYLTDVIGRKAQDFIDQYVEGEATSASEADQSKPFLMVLSTPAPHDPFTPAPQYQNWYLKEWKFIRE